MKRIILFRFHKNLRVCKNRLELLKKFNPNISIYGLYGGKISDYKQFKTKLSPYLKNICCIKNRSKDWKWKNSDLAINLWYKKIGNSVPFDMLHIIEWDLLLLDALDKIYKKIPKNGIGLTALTLLQNVENKWSWTSNDPEKSEWSNLLNFAKKKFDYRQKPFASLGPGACLPKSFIEKYRSLEFPEICHDELRLPLFGQILKYKLYDTEFCKNWFDAKDEKIFNCMGKNIGSAAIKKEFDKPTGRRVFHPYRKIFEI